VVVVVTVFLISDVRTAADAVTILLLGVSLAVAAVPEGLPAILSVVLALGVQRMASHRAIVKKLSSVETLGSASVIASDKTGTLTKSEMTVQRVMTASGQARVTGIGYAPEGSVITEHGAELTDGPQLAENIVVLSGGSLASNADLQQRDGDWQIQGDPTEAAFLAAERKLGVTERRAQRFERVAEIPFTSERGGSSRGSGIFDDIKRFLRYLLSCNMGEVLTVFLGVVFAGVIGLTGTGEAVVLPLLATQILWINLITDSGLALAMGVDPETEDVMARPPRRLTDRID
jgi:magnesium-transporting ATPase (P-type)